MTTDTVVMSRADYDKMRTVEEQFTKRRDELEVEHKALCKVTQEENALYAIDRYENYHGRETSNIVVFNKARATELLLGHLPTLKRVANLESLLAEANHLKDHNVPIKRAAKWWDFLIGK